MQIDSFQAHSKTDDPLLTPFRDDLPKSFLMSSDVSVQKIACWTVLQSVFWYLFHYKKNKQTKNKNKATGSTLPSAFSFPRSEWVTAWSWRPSSSLVGMRGICTVPRP